MCNSYEQRVAWQEYCRMMEELHWGIPSAQSAADLPPSDMVHINDPAPVIRAAGNGVELAQMRFGFPPARPKGGPVFNMRSEGRHFDKSQRCLIPATAFFEYTGTKYPKMRHRFTLKGAPFMAIAAIWRPAENGQPQCFSMLTTEPGPDVAPIHNRQVVVLNPTDWPAWIYLTKPEKQLLQPLPGGSFATETPA